MFGHSFLLGGAMSENIKLTTTRPEKIFLCDQVIQYTSILDAAIIGDLYYWIAKGKKPWRKASDYENLFRVNEKTIRNRFNSLTNEYRYLNRKRPRLDNGGFGAYQFSSNNTSNSKTLVSIYQGILNNSDINHDFGDFDPSETDYREIPRTQLLLTSSIEQTNCIKSAYLLDRICWAMVSRCQGELYFSNKAHLARWSSIKYKTAFRLIESLKTLGLADFDCKSGQLIIWANDCSSLNFFTDYMAGKHEVRTLFITEAAA